jgi:serine/threonine protein phosphatase PrpC
MISKSESINLEANSPKDSFYQFSFAEDPNLGVRKVMEDFTIAEPRLDKSGEWGLFVILDGHGGSNVAEYAKANYPRILKEMLEVDEPDQNVKVIIEASIQKLSNELISLANVNGGSTFCGLLINSVKKIFFVINIGDSSLATVSVGDDGKNLNFKILTNGHKVSNLQEKERIVHLNGLIHDRVGGQLLVTRALGDFAFEPFGLSHSPEINEYPISKEKYILLASDGVWDVIDSKQALILIDQNKDETINELVQSFVEDAKLTSTDNISMIGLKF